MTDRPGAVLVTGGAKRIGRAIALDLAAEGWALAVHYRRSQDEAQAVVGEIEAAGGQAIAVSANLALESDSAALVGRATTALGRPLTALINNASTFEHDDMDTATRQSWDVHLEANLRAPLVLSQAFARQLPQGVPGNIINLLDQRVWNLTSEFISYTLSKAGLWTLTQTMALALAPDIRVNAIGPGPVLASTHQSDAEFKAQNNALPLGQSGSPADIAAAVRYILCAGALTGQMIALDGGQHLAWSGYGSTKEVILPQ